jgi:hypothetical protein
MLKIYVSEEYGFRSWIWTFPGNKKALQKAWDDRNRPDNFFNPSVGKYPGTMQQTFEHFDPEKFDAYAHVHEEDDTWLELDPIIPEKSEAEENAEDDAWMKFTKPGWI